MGMHYPILFYPILPYLHHFEASTRMLLKAQGNTSSEAALWKNAVPSFLSLFLLPYWFYENPALLAHITIGVSWRRDVVATAVAEMGIWAKSGTSEWSPDLYNGYPGGRIQNGPAYHLSQNLLGDFVLFVPAILAVLFPKRGALLSGDGVNISLDHTLGDCQGTLDNLCPGTSR